jgi:acyl carrier protein
MTASPGFDIVVDYLRAAKPELGEVAPDLDLIENRVLDSLAFVEFLLLLEEHTGREISIDSISREDFRTLNSIKERFFDGTP